MVEVAGDLAVVVVAAVAGTLVVVVMVDVVNVRHVMLIPMYSLQNTEAAGS